MSGFDDTKPIYMQIKERIEEQIVSNQLKEEDQIPSTTQFVNFYKINHLTVAKGIHLLVEDGTIYKKRGVGMFVAKGAKQRLLQRRKASFVDQYIEPLLKEADNLEMTVEELVQLIMVKKGRDHS